MKEMALKAVAGFLLLAAGTLMRMIRPARAEQQPEGSEHINLRKAA